MATGAPPDDRSHTPDTLRESRSEMMIAGGRGRERGGREGERGEGRERGGGREREGGREGVCK